MYFHSFAKVGNHNHIRPHLSLNQPIHLNQNRPTFYYDKSMKIVCYSYKNAKMVLLVFDRLSSINHCSNFKDTQLESDFHILCQLRRRFFIENVFSIRVFGRCFFLMYSFSEVTLLTWFAYRTRLILERWLWSTLQLSSL